MKYSIRRIGGDWRFSILRHSFDNLVIKCQLPSVSNNLIELLLLKRWRNALVHLKAIIRVLKLLWYPEPECVTESLKSLESDAERIIAKKINSGKPLFMIKWQGYCSSQNTWEPKAHLSPELIEAFENPDPDPVRVDEARERIGLVFEREMKVPLQYKESVEIRHDVIRFLFPNISVELQAAATDICDQELHDAGLAPYVERTINAMGADAVSCS